MTRIYVYRGEYGHREKSHAMIRECAARFLAACADAGSSRYSGLDPDDLVIAEAEKGKPYFAPGQGGTASGALSSPLPHFSVSNSRDVWICAMSDEECGIDVQFALDHDWEAICGRFFLPAEKLHVERRGEEGFYHAWTRKEALGKLSGEGIFGGGEPVADSIGRLRPRVRTGGRTAHLAEIDLGAFLDEETISDSRIFCALCTYDKGPTSVEPLSLCH